MNTSSIPSSRDTAARLVYQWRTSGEMPERMFSSIRRDRAFVMEMVLGIVRRDNTMRWIIRWLAARDPDDKMSAILAVGLYQLLFMDHVEVYAAVNETVEVAHAQGGKGAAGFVNAILRRAERDKGRILKELEEQSLAIRSGHPPDLLDRWTLAYGVEATRALCAWNNERPELLLRVRPVVTAEDFEAALGVAGIKVDRLAVPGFYRIPSGSQIERLPGYEQGWFVIQDPATLLAIDALGVAPGERILDACAAPGGKTIGLADRMGGEGELVAMDSSTPRLRVLRQNLGRCGLLKGVRVRRFDATRMTLAEPDREPFDGVLLDVPCSNTGVIRRRPDVRWRITSAHLRQLVDLQRQLLLRHADRVREGGRLVYSTCSLEREENEVQVRHFLEARSDFVLAEEGRRFPPEDGTDGAYVARLERRG